MVEPLYPVNVKCLYCEVTFQTMKVRPSFKKSYKSDTDFCLYFKEMNPDFYVVRVCPFCGFATTENFSDKLTAGQKMLFEDKIRKNWVMKDYSRERDWEDAMTTYKLALVVAQIKEEKDRVVAGLLHHIAWLYRYQGNEVQEKRFLQFALESYIGVFEKEGMDVNNAKLMYLIGELHRRLGDFKNAVKWFARVVNDRKIMDAGMIRACREQWSVAREDMLQQQMEIPEDGQIV